MRGEQEVGGERQTAAWISDAESKVPAVGREGRKQKQIPFGNDKEKGQRRKTKTNTGILRCAQNDKPMTNRRFIQKDKRKKSFGVQSCLQAILRLSFCCGGGF
jgi:hypothetical protein